MCFASRTESNKTFNKTSIVARTLRRCNALVAMICCHTHTHRCNSCCVQERCAVAMHSLQSRCASNQHASPLQQSRADATNYTPIAITFQVPISKCPDRFLDYSARHAQTYDDGCGRSHTHVTDNDLPLLFLTSLCRLRLPPVCRFMSCTCALLTAVCRLRLTAACRFMSCTCALLIAVWRLLLTAACRFSL